MRALARGYLLHKSNLVETLGGKPPPPGSKRAWTVSGVDDAFDAAVMDLAGELHDAVNAQCLDWLSRRTREEES
jgi:hypothetical protein